MRYLFAISISLLLITACSPTDSAVYGVRKQLVAYEKIPIDRTPTHLVQMNDRVRIVVNTSRVFAQSSAKFDRDYRKLLSQLENFLSNNKMPKKIVVNGYQDGAGDPERMKAISKEQAQALAAYIWALGVPSDLIKVVAHGNKNPVSYRDTASGNIENRRIDVDIF